MANRGLSHLLYAIKVLKSIGHDLSAYDRWENRRGAALKSLKHLALDAEVAGFISDYSSSLTHRLFKLAQEQVRPGEMGVAVVDLLESLFRQASREKQRVQGMPPKPAASPEIGMGVLAA